MTFRLSLFTSYFLVIHGVLATSSLQGRQEGGQQEVVLVNNCPEPINVLRDGQFEVRLLAGTNRTRAGAPALWYTDANGGGSTTGIVRAEISNGFYYIVKDGLKPLNTGLSIRPLDIAPTNGWCESATCTSSTCTTAFPFFPITIFPPLSSPAPPPEPYYRCADASRYQVTFCPSGAWPGGDGTATIRPALDTSKCLDVRGALLANGTPVQLYDCNGTAAQRWEITAGATKVRLAGTNFCLDAGSSPANGVGMKIWQCYDNLVAQSWSFNNDREIRLGNTGQCLDVKDGNTANSNQVQTWACNPSNPNQAWSVEYS